jgi:prepilin-type N-terminal cleavage/methylation domain-containing protein
MTATVRRAQPAAGFTLIEVMISVALALLLILGINLVFSTTSRTVGTGQVLSSAIRDSRAGQTVFYSDLGSAVSGGGPALIIRNQAVPAFRNREDELADRDYVAGEAEPTRSEHIRSRDMDGDNNENDPAILGEVTNAFTYNHRNHRTDTLSFFARGQFPRQTGNDGTFAAPMTASEAWIWYGHLRLPNNDSPPAGPIYQAPSFGSFGFAGQANQNNFHACNWILGRMAMLLKPEGPARPTSPPNEPPQRINDMNGEAQEHMAGYVPPSASDPAGTSPLRPLAFNTPATNGSTTPPADFVNAIQTSRYDLAGGSVDIYQAGIGTFITTPATLDNTTRTQQWWQRLLFTPGSSGYSATTANIAAAAIDPQRAYRFHAERLFARPLDSAKAARLAPAMFTGCSQFMVEYAGDFLQQNNDPSDADYGLAIGVLSDGIEDFVIDRGADGTRPPVRRTRWYGLPRDVTGSPTGGPDGAFGLIDVVPLRDIRATITPTPNPVEAPFERFLPVAPPTANPNYICVWGPPGSYVLEPGESEPPRPSKLRIVVTLDDPNGRLPDGQTFEHVINLP